MEHDNPSYKIVEKASKALDAALSIRFDDPIKDIAELIRLRGIIEQRETEIEDLKTQIKKADCSSNDGKSMITTEEFDAKRKSLELEIHRQSTQIMSLQDSNADKDEGIAELNRQIVMLKVQVVTEDECRNRNQPEKDKIKAEIDAITEALKKLRRPENGDEMDNLRDKLNTLEYDLEKLESSDLITNQECTDRNTEARNHYEETIAKLRGNISVLELEAATANQTINNPNREIIGLKSLVANSQETLIDDERAQMNKDILDALNKEIEKLQKVIVDIKVELDESKLNTLTIAECDERNKAEIDALETKLDKLVEDTLQDMITEEQCEERNQAEKAELADEINRLREELEDARKEANVPDQDENKTLRERIAELDKYLMKYKTQIQSCRADLKALEVLPDQSGLDLADCKKNLEDLEAENAHLRGLMEDQTSQLEKASNQGDTGADKLVLEKNIETLQRRADYLERGMKAAEQREGDLADKLDELRAERDAVIDERDQALQATASTIDEYNQWFDREAYWAREFGKIQAEMEVLRETNDDDKLKDCWTRRNAVEEELATLQLEKEELQKKLKEAEAEKATGNAELERLQEEIDGLNANQLGLNQSLAYAIERLNKMKAELKTAMQSPAENPKNCKDEVKSLRDDIKALGTANQTLADETERLKALLKKQPTKDKSWSSKAKPKEGQTILQLRTNLNRVTREFENLKSRYEALRDRNNRTGALHNVYQGLLRDNNIPFLIFGGADEPEPLTDLIPRERAPGQDPKSFLEVQAAILRAQIELNHMIADRATTGFVQDDTHTAINSITIALEMVEFLAQKEERTLKLLAEANFWNFLILCYSDDLTAAADALTEVDKYLEHLHTEDQRESVSEWVALSQFPPVPRTAQAYGGAPRKPRSSSSSSESIAMQRKKSKISKGKERATDKKKKCTRAKKDLKGKGIAIEITGSETSTPQQDPETDPEDFYSP